MTPPTKPCIGYEGHECENLTVISRFCRNLRCSNCRGAHKKLYDRAYGAILRDRNRAAKAAAKKVVKERPNRRRVYSTLQLQWMVERHFIRAANAVLGGEAEYSRV